MKVTHRLQEVVWCTRFTHTFYSMKIRLLSETKDIGMVQLPPCSALLGRRMNTLIVQKRNLINCRKQSLDIDLRLYSLVPYVQILSPPHLNLVFNWPGGGSGDQSPKKQTMYYRCLWIWWSSSKDESRSWGIESTFYRHLTMFATLPERREGFTQRSDQYNSRLVSLLRYSLGRSLDALMGPIKSRSSGPLI